MGHVLRGMEDHEAAGEGALADGFERYRAEVRKVGRGSVERPLDAFERAVLARIERVDGGAVPGSDAPAVPGETNPPVTPVWSQVRLP